MKKLKLVSGLIIIFLIINITIHVISFLFWQNYLLSETKSLLGVFSYEEAISAADCFRQYIEADPYEKTQFLNNGAQALNDAGYSFSARKHICTSASVSIAPICVISIALNTILIIFILRSIRQVLKGWNDCEQNLIKSKAHIATLESQHDKELTQIGQFEENLYHQIKTPLTSLQLCIEQIKTNYHVSNDQVYMTAQMQLRKMSRLTTLFLRDRKLSSNVVKFQFNLQSLDEILGEAIMHLYEYALYQGIKLKVHVMEGEYFLHCDQNWLLECLVTLVENAIDHAIGVVDIVLAHEARKYRIQICTKGVTISEDQIEQIFDRYYTSSTSHFGIGLHMAKSVIETHHGQIIAYNKPGDDPCVCFDVSLPILSNSEIYIVT